MKDIVWWANYVKSHRDTNEEPVPLCNEMLDQLTKEELKDYYSRIKHLQGEELWDSEADFLRISGWSEIIYAVKQKIEEKK